MGEMTGRILVLGGSGFIGQHVLRHACKAGLQVTSVAMGIPKAPMPEVSYKRANVADISSLEDSLGRGQFEYVVNLSGYIDHTSFAQGGANLIDQHFSGLLNLVQLLDRSVLEGFVQVGSSDEYGASPAPQREDFREAPISPYSLGKTAATHFMQMMHHTENFPGVVLRIFLVYGPGQGMGRFLPQIISGCLKGETFPASEGDQLRDFCHVDDVANAILLAAKSTDVNGEVINIASGQPISIRTMIEKVRAIIGQGDPCFGQIPQRGGENMELYADISKAKRLLSWQPRIALKEGLGQTIASVRKTFGENL